MSRELPTQPSRPMIADLLVQMWEVNNRANLLLLDELPADALECTLSTRGGRTVGQQFAHVIDVRRTRVELADKSLVKGWEPVGRERGNDGQVLRRGFEESGKAVSELIRRSLADGADGRIKGYPRGITVLIGYLVAHDAHHRGHALLTIKQSGKKIPEGARWKIWEWEKL